MADLFQITCPRCESVLVPNGAWTWRCTACETHYEPCGDALVERASAGIAQPVRASGNSMKPLPGRVVSRS